MFIVASTAPNPITVAQSLRLYPRSLGRQMISRIAAENTNLKVTMPSAPTNGNSTTANEAPTSWQASPAITMPTGQSVAGRCPPVPGIDGPGMAALPEPVLPEPVLPEPAPADP